MTVCCSNAAAGMPLCWTSVVALGSRSLSASTRRHHPCTACQARARTCSRTDDGQRHRGPAHFSGHGPCAVTAMRERRALAVLLAFAAAGATYV